MSSEASTAVAPSSSRDNASNWRLVSLVNVLLGFFIGNVLAAMAVIVIGVEALPEQVLVGEALSV